ncbi:MAG TPA: arsenate reductase (azurin) small subunit [Rhodospirillales bacterium]|jgi:arsenite oxidase small subunit|nr:arsenate reductase (azurin) small subunit [Rhodospirillales bacterium]
MKIETQTAITVNQARDIVASGAAQEGHGKCLMSRRQFLLTSGATSVVMVSAAPGLAATPAMVSTYPRQKIAKLSQLKADQPVDFSYPDKGAFSESMVVKLGIEAGGGVGPGHDVVAFNYACTHQGGTLSGTYKGDTKSLGACPLHLSTYDLTRHGILISGQAYQSLPQVLLELQGDDVYAVGVFGLIFGRYDNLQG